mgnify:CR=1 FL=1
MAIANKVKLISSELMHLLMMLEVLAYDNVGHDKDEENGSDFKQHTI